MRFETMKQASFHAKSRGRRRFAVRRRRLSVRWDMSRASDMSQARDGTLRPARRCLGAKQFERPRWKRSERRRRRCGWNGPRWNGPRWFECVSGAAVWDIRAGFGEDPDYVVTKATEKWVWFDMNPNHAPSDCTDANGCERPLPWDRYTLSNYEKMVKSRRAYSIRLSTNQGT